MYYIFESNSVEDTKRLGKYISDKFINRNKSNIITLEGEIGSGKTLLCQYIVQALFGKDIQVTSPTFNVLNIYEQGNFRIYHYDFYRISNPQEIGEFGLEDAFNNLLTLIEWPSLAKRYLPRKRLEINIQKADGRIIEISEIG